MTELVVPRSIPTALRGRAGTVAASSSTGSNERSIFMAMERSHCAHSYELSRSVALTHRTRNYKPQLLPGG
jgi:hypothetical protein